MTRPSAGDAANGERRLSGWLQELERRHPTEIDLGLGRCGAVYQRLGSPRPGTHVITVAGTNGKGSTVAWSNACLSALGMRTGVYTSPHLLHFTERLQLLGAFVTPGALVEAFEQVEAARADVSLTYFEFTTLACLWLMHRARLDVAILEVGMGGRLDTVNLVDADVAVITPVGLDHQAFLGNDRESIGREKAGILRSGQIFISAEREPPATVLEQAGALGCRTLRLGQDFAVAHDPEDGLEFHLGNWRLPLAGLQLSGVHQQDNLAGALAAVFSLFPDHRVRAEPVSAALQAVRLPGRLQRVDIGPGFLVDVGHNPMGAQAIATALEGQPPVVCVLAMLADKDAEGVARALAPVVKSFLCAGLQAGQRTQSGAALAQRVMSACEQAEVLAMGTVDEAMEEALARAEDNGPVLVFGSFHTAAEALGWLEARGGKAY